MTREEAIKRIKAWDLDSDDREVLEVIIPELRESEDERIRKELIKVVSDIAGDWPFEKHEITKKEALAYLEKQKESLHIPETCKENANSFTEDERIRQWLYNLVDEGAYLCERPFATESILSYLEKQKERGPLTKEEEYTLHRIIEYLEDETCPSEWISLLHGIYCLPYGKQKESAEKEYVFRPLGGTDIIVAAEQAIKRVNEGERLVLAFNGAYIPVLKGYDVNEIVDIYNTFVEKKKEPPFVKDVNVGYPGYYFYDGNRMYLCSSPALEEKQKEQKTTNELEDAFKYYTDRGITISCGDFKAEPKKERIGEYGECTDFTIYHPIKNGKGEYECIPYSFYGSLTSFSEDKDLIDFLRTCFYTEEECNEWIEKQKEQNSVECIEFDNEFEKQVSHLLASVLNGEWEYDEGFVKHAAQSLLGYAKNEMKPELPLMGGDTDTYFDDLRMTTKPLISREWFDEGIKYAQRLQKEQKPNIELIQRSWYMEGYHDREFGQEPKWILKTGEDGPKHELNPRYGQPLAEQRPTEEQLHNLNEAIKGLRMDGFDRMADSLDSLYNILKTQEQKPNYCLYGGDPSVGRCRWCYASCSARLTDVHTDDEKEYIRTIKSIISDFIRDKKPENLEYYQRIYDWLDGRHVPFSCGHENGEPADYNEYKMLIDGAREDGKIEGRKEVIDHSDKYGLTKQKPMDFPTTDEEVKEFLETHPKIEVPEKYKTPDFVFSKQEYESHPIISTDTTSTKPVEFDGKALLHTADKSYQIGFRDGVASVKPAEWSEEDEDMLNSCISSIEEAKENRYAYKETDGDTSYDHEIAWLKSLRPTHWKPSEHQMNILKAVKDYVSKGSGYWGEALGSLIEDLEKLI